MYALNHLSHQTLILGEAPSVATPMCSQPAALTLHAPLDSSPIQDQKVLGLLEQNIQLAYRLQIVELVAAPYGLIINKDLG